MLFRGLVGFMGTGDIWGFIIFHKSEWGFMVMIYDLLKKSSNSHQVYAIKCHEFNMVPFDDKWRHFVTFHDIMAKNHVG